MYLFLLSGLIGWANHTPSLGLCTECVNFAANRSPNVCSTNEIVCFVRALDGAVVLTMNILLLQMLELYRIVRARELKARNQPANQYHGLIVILWFY